MKRTIAILLLVLCVLVPASAWADAIPVDLQLSLLVDVSGSVNSSEFNLQMRGYVEAFQSSEVIGAIAANDIGAIAVNLVFWSGRYEQKTAVDWFYIGDAGTSFDFASALSELKRPYSGSTSISGALSYATELFATDETYLATKEVIDISGDGTNNQDPYGTNLKSARADALAAGIVINGLPIGSKSLAEYYESNVIGGDDSFIVRAKDYYHFTESLQKKLVTEISSVPSSGTPEPASMLLMASALGVVGAVRLRRRRRGKPTA
ncbi:MAG: DUF1194 domain-containing protein [Desulfarculaceae bacterium]|nr:DUF1194 domain-containing protein [Desulfarculaceae bacterium]MCF8071025.1 DUF1194 domain-containing protein [Desulfarculaceae bacterium]MCF8100613.1 DUF1194 domain-containing protein [Desulfarculaceae bacterium]MCF8116953.1 DUF1194 domain-containing protein [Desulfarculaceae bacterium]